MQIHEGTYSRKAVKLPLHPIPAPPTQPTLVKVIKIEEKGSDVNLATWLLIDAFDKAFDAAVVLTNDSDLAEPIRQVRQKLRLPGDDPAFLLEARVAARASPCGRRSACEAAVLR